MSKFYKAAISHWEAQRDNAIATLELYFLKSVGIGEHPDIIGAIDEQLNLLTQAEEKLQAVEHHFTPDRVI